jgi:hypothetical protein
VAWFPKHFPSSKTGHIEYNITFLVTCLIEYRISEL